MANESLKPSVDAAAPVEGPAAPVSEFHDSTPKGWKIRGKHPPGAWIVRIGGGGNGAQAEAYRNGYDAIDWSKKS